MSKNELIEIVSEAYQDNYIADMYWDFEKEKPVCNLEAGDTLALFIALEINDCYDSEASDVKQLIEAQRIIASATEELDKIYYHLNDIILEHQST